MTGVRQRSKGDCTTIIRVLPADYERVRSVATHFLYAAGHADDIPHSRVIETLEGATIVEKSDGPGRVAEKTDPRGSPPHGGGDQRRAMKTYSRLSSVRGSRAKPL
jgi:hypothetical protein